MIRFFSDNLLSLGLTDASLLIKQAIGEKIDQDIWIIQLGANVKMMMEIRLYYYNWYDQIKYIRDKMQRMFYKCFTEWIIFVL